MMLLMSLSYKKWRNSVYLRPLLGLAFPSSSFFGRREQNFKISGPKNTSLVEQVERACHVGGSSSKQNKTRAVACGCHPSSRSRPHSLKAHHTATERWKRLEHEITATRSIYLPSRISNCHTLLFDLLPISFCCIGFEKDRIRRACNHAHITHRTLEKRHVARAKAEREPSTKFPFHLPGPQVHGIIWAFLGSYLASSANTCCAGRATKSQLTHLAPVVEVSDRKSNKSIEKLEEERHTQVNPFPVHLHDPQENQHPQ